MGVSLSEFDERRFVMLTRKLRKVKMMTYWSLTMYACICWQNLPPFNLIRAITKTFVNVGKIFMSTFYVNNNGLVMSGPTLQITVFVQTFHNFLLVTILITTVIIELHHTYDDTED